MANQPEQPIYDTGVYQIEVSDPVDGGVGSVTNNPLLSLSDRTAYLKQHVDNLEAGVTIPPTVAPLNSPQLTGSPVAPTGPVGDATTLIATDQFVQETANGSVSVPVGGNANVVLTQPQWGVAIVILTGLLTGNISVVFPTQSGRWEVRNNTTGNFTVTCKTAAGTGVTVAQAKSREIYCDGTNILLSTDDFTNIALAGSSTAVTQVAADNTPKIATDQFVTLATDGMAPVNVAGGANVVLTPQQYGLAMLNLTGALTADVTLTFPQGVTGQWVVANNATGNFNVTATTGAVGGKATVFPQGSAIIIYSDGTNINPASSIGQEVSFRRQEFSYAGGTLPVGTTSLDVVGGFTPGGVIVEKNGGWLGPEDFDQSTSPSIKLTTATLQGDEINVYSFATFVVADAILRSGDAMAGPFSVLLASTATDAVPLGQLIGLIGDGANVYSSTANGTTATWLADQFIVGTEIGGLLTLLSSVNASVNLATVGIGGVDVSGSLVGQNMAVYLMYNPAAQTVGLMLQAMGTAVAPLTYSGAHPVAGYTQSGLISSVKTDATGKFVQFMQDGKEISFSAVSVTIPNATGAFTVLSLAAAVTPNARSVGGDGIINTVGATNISLYVSTDTSQNGQKEIIGLSVNVAGSVSGNFSDITINRKTTPQEIAFSLSASAGALSLAVIRISSYRI